MHLTKPQQLWLEALESGKFGQTKKTLERRGKFCCLGVACKVAEDNGIEVIKYEGKLVGDDLEPQVNVKKWLNIRKYPRNKISPISMNDILEYDFKKIAQEIRNNPEAYFYPESEGDDCE